MSIRPSESLFKNRKDLARFSVVICAFSFVFSALPVEAGQKNSSKNFKSQTVVKKSKSKKKSSRSKNKSSNKKKTSKTSGSNAEYSNFNSSSSQPSASISGFLVTTVAGMGRAIDGIGTAATFSSPYGVATDSLGNVFVADSENAKIRKISPIGVVTTHAGSGYPLDPTKDPIDGPGSTKDGPASVATFRQPEGIAVDAFGTVYVADTWDHKIRKITPDGMVSTLAGSGVEGDQNGLGNQALFNMPKGIAVDRSGTVFVVDSENHKIRKISPDGGVTTFAGSGESGHKDGVGSQAAFSYPEGIAIDTLGNLYVADGNIRKITPTGEVSTLNIESIDVAKGIAVSSDGNLYLTTGDRVFKVFVNGAIATQIAGSEIRGSSDGPGNQASFSYPFGIAVDNVGNLFIADVNNDKIRKLDGLGVVSTFAGVGNRVDGVGNQSSFQFPEEVVADASGNVFVSDWNKIRKVAPNGLVTTFAGSGEYGPEDGVGTQAAFDYISGLAIDKNGYIYAAARDDQQIRKVSPGGVVSTYAGSGEKGNTDGSTTNATFNDPVGLAADYDGNLFVIDTGSKKIRRISASGMVSTVASLENSSYPSGIAVDGTGTLFVTDSGNHKILKISGGAVSTFAGSGIQGSTNGFGQAASFNGPVGISIDSLGNLYVSEFLGNKIRKITPSGMVSTIGGTGIQGSKDGFGSTATFYLPLGLAVDAFGNILVADSGNAKIRKTTFSK